MKRFDEWFMPEQEQHLPDWMSKVNRRVEGRLTYQYGKYEESLKFLKNNRTAIDVGGHIGLWSYFMARDFEHLIAFEPVIDHAKCWAANMIDRENAQILHYALGDREAMVELECRTPGSSGDTQIKRDNAPGKILMRPLDNFGFKDVDLIKIDTEGFECNVLLGGEKTIRECKPVVIVEQKGTMSQKYGFPEKAAVDLLKSWGAVERMEISGDHILSWD